MAILNVSEIQPNSDKRNEFLIVLDYLLHFTGDEKHCTSQKKIMDYAKDQYGVDIRRDRIPQILLHLYQLTEKYPDKFPFKLKCVTPKSMSDEDDGARRKYYISERAFTEKEILKIVSAIQSDSTITADATKTLVDKVLKETVQDTKVASFQQKLAKKQRKTSKFTAKGMQFLELIEDLVIKNERVWFKLENSRDADFDMKIPTMIKSFRLREEHVGYIYGVREINNKFIVIVYLPEYKHAFITPITNFKIVNHMDLNDISHPCDFILDNDKYASIDEWVDKHYSGQDGNVREVIFKFTIDPTLEKENEYVIKTFEKHWKKRMVYEIKEREIPTYSFNKDTMELEPAVIKVKDAYVKLETNLESFKHWYEDYKILSSVVIVSPAELNDYWLAPLVSRLAKRMTKYGSKYDYELTKNVKPEYANTLSQLSKKKSNNQ